MKILRQTGAIHLAVVALCFMLLALAAMVFLYTIRYGRLPLAELRAGWDKPVAAISDGLQQAGPAATVDRGISRCTIRGQLVYSDNACSASNPSTREVKLHDNRGFEAPKAPPAASAGQDADAQEIRAKIIDGLAK